MYSFREVSRRVFENECGGCDNWLELYNEDIYKRHKNYFNELAKGLMIENDDLEALKKEPGKKFAFTEDGAELLEDLLTQYGKSMKQKDRTTLTKNLEKQIFKDNQHNAFIPRDLLDNMKEMISANNLVVLAIETFYQLLVDAGLSDADAEEIMEKAYRKFKYSSRKMYQKMMIIFEHYIFQLDQINSACHEPVELTEREKAIWLNYANSELERIVARVLQVRKMMVKWATTEIRVFLREKAHQILKAGREDNLKKNENNELRIQVELDLLDDDKSRDMIVQYEKIMGCKFNSEEFVACAIAVSLVANDKDEDVQQLLLEDLLGIPSTGNIRRKKGDAEKLKDVLKSLYDFVDKEKNNYDWSDVFEDGKANRSRDTDLLKKAEEFVKCNEIRF